MIWLVEWGKIIVLHRRHAFFVQFSDVVCQMKVSRTTWTHNSYSFILYIHFNGTSTSSFAAYNHENSHPFPNVNFQVTSLLLKLPILYCSLTLGGISWLTFDLKCSHKSYSHATHFVSLIKETKWVACEYDLWEYDLWKSSVTVLENILSCLVHPYECALILQEAWSNLSVR